MKFKGLMNKDVAIGSVKVVSGLIAGFGAKKIIKFAVEKVVPEALGNADKVLVVVGTIAIAGAVGNAVGQAVYDIIDQTLFVANITKQTIEELMKDEEKNEDVGRFVFVPINEKEEL